jgi:hypothetical protein
MKSVVLTYIGTMVTALIVLMLLLNGYLGSSSSNTAQRQQLPTIGQVAAAPTAAVAGTATAVRTPERQAGPQAPAVTPKATDVATVAASRDTAVAPAPAAAATGQAPKATETAPAPQPIPATAALAPFDVEVTTTPAAAPEAAKPAPQKTAARRKPHRPRDRPSALGFNQDPSYGRGNYGPFSSSAGARF